MRSLLLPKKLRQVGFGRNKLNDVQRQIHDDLRLQHPEWIEPNGESAMCDAYEARLMELLNADAKGLS